MNKDYQETICWLCKHAVPNTEDRGCSWSMFGEPVPGWDATPTEIVGSVYNEHSFCVHACPCFERG